MADITKEQVLETLKTVRGPDLEHNIVELGMVSDVFISDGKVYFSLTVPADRAKELEPLRLAAERVVKDMPGVKGALVALTADKKAGAPAARPAPPQAAAHTHSHPHPPQQQPRAGKIGVPGVGAIIAVASGKGGCWQIDNGGQSGAWPARQWPARRHSRCRYLWPVDAAPAQDLRQAVTDRWPHHRSHGKLWSEGHVDGFPRRRGNRDDLARAYGAVRVAADVAGSRLGRTRRPGGGHAARYRRCAVDHGAAGAARRRGDCLDTAGSGADRCAQGAQHVPKGRGPCPRHR
jgi:metal-sulfur cluster biosynthetic enzyme